MFADIINKLKNSLSSSDFRKRLIMTLIFVPLTGVSVAFYNLANFGVDPFTVLVQGTYNKMPSAITYGLTYIIISVIEVIAIFFIDKKKIGIGTFINLFLLACGIIIMRY